MEANNEPDRRGLTPTSRSRVLSRRCTNQIFRERHEAHLKFDHLGVVVPQLFVGRNHLAALFGIVTWTEAIEDPVNNVWVQFGIDASGMCYELVAPRNDQSPVTEALKRGGPILNHVAYLVGSIELEAARLQSSGCRPIGEVKPAIAYGGRNIQFLMSPLKFILEIIEAIDHKHRYQVIPRSSQ